MLLANKQQQLIGNHIRMIILYVNIQWVYAFKDEHFFSTHLVMAVVNNNTTQS